MLYDLTSSYVEGSGDNKPLLQRGYSRDHRGDCKQVVIALIVNPEGFPLSYETFDGNRADVTTLEATILRMVERKYGKARRIWVIRSRHRQRGEPGGDSQTRMGSIWWARRAAR